MGGSDLVELLSPDRRLSRHHLEEIKNPDPKDHQNENYARYDEDKVPEINPEMGEPDEDAKEVKIFAAGLQSRLIETKEEML